MGVMHWGAAVLAMGFLACSGSEFQSDRSGASDNVATGTGSDASADATGTGSGSDESAPGTGTGGQAAGGGRDASTDDDMLGTPRTGGNGGASATDAGTDSSAGGQAGAGLDCTLAGCDDDNVCTEDQCINGTCVHVANADVCDDGNACTVGDRCAQKQCQPGTLTQCEMNETCNPMTGACDCVDTAVRCSGVCTLPAERQCVPGDVETNYGVCEGTRSCNKACQWVTTCVDGLYCAPDHVYWRCLQNNCYAEGGECSG